MMRYRVNLHFHTLNSLSMGLMILMASCGNPKPKATRAKTQAEAQGQSSPELSGPAAGQMRRLSKPELDHTIISLLGDSSHLPLLLPPDEESHGYTNGYNLGVSQLFLDQWQMFAQQIAGQAVKVGAVLQKESADCLSNQDSQKCAETFIKDFGKRGFRRPLRDEEVLQLKQVFNAGAALGTYAQGQQLVIEAILLAPSFLYKTEIGPDEANANTIYELTPYELASQLAYALTGYPPDAALMAAVEAGHLSNKTEIDAQARRLLSSPQGLVIWRDFIFSWLKIGEVDSIQRNHALWSNELPKAFRTETEMFIEHIMSEEQGSLIKLLNAEYSFLDQKLSGIYGLNSPTQKEFMMTTLNRGERRGILTQSSFLSVHAQVGGSSPVRRGLIILQRLFCQDLPPPPPGVAVVPSESATGTTRERFAAHSANPSCQGCHNRIDPLGFAFENYDGLGVYRSQENGQVVDASGVIGNLGDASFAFNNGRDLIDRLAVSNEIHECVTTQLFRYAMGRQETDEDSQLIEQSLQLGKAASMDMREILLALVNSTQFKQRLKARP